MKRSTAWILVAVVWLLAAGLSNGVRPNRYREGRSRDPRTRVEVNQSSMARILGEFRTGMSDMLFIKTERYLHSGVGYVPHLTEKLLTVEGTEEGVEEHLEEMDEQDATENDARGHGVEEESEEDKGGEESDDPFHHEEEAETLVPTEQTDYRGWIGRMHREVKPWRDPTKSHRHTDGKELIPWFRMMTLSDPGYVRGYVIGAFWLGQYDWDAGMKFLDEGLEKNPEAFQLFLSKGFMLMERARKISQSGLVTIDESEQAPLLLEAKESFRRAADLAIIQRPPEPEEGDIRDHPDWGRYQEQDAFSATNMAVVFEEKFGDPETAHALRVKYLEAMPSHGRLKLGL